ncbi:MAG: hypothetical protein R3C10_18920 [Pirellulales bacterium]
MNEALNQPFTNNPSLIPLYPSGPVDVVTLPFLPQDEMVMLPDGSVLMGTGGDGRFDVISMDGSLLTDVPFGVGDPVRESTKDVKDRITDGIYLMNPEETGATVNYVVDNFDFSMKSGFSQHLVNDRTWKIRFDRGDGSDQITKTLTDGTWMFVNSDDGWNVEKVTFRLTVDNSKK